MAGIQTVDTGHEDMIHDAKLNYYGTTLATASSDESIKIFTIQNKRQTLVATLNDHCGPVWNLSWSHPMFGNLLASCGYDKKVIIWREMNGQWQKVYEYLDHTSSVNCVEWAPHSLGLMLATASSDGSIAILTFDGVSEWHTNRIQTAHNMGVNSVSWCPAVDTNFLLNPSLHSTSPLVKRLVSGGCDTLVKIWCEDANGEWIEESRLEAHSDWVRDVAWSPSLMLTRQQIASCGQDGRVIIWQASTTTAAGLPPAQSTTTIAPQPNSTSQPVASSKDYTRSLTGPLNWCPTVLTTCSSAVWHLSWTVTGGMLAVSSADNKITLWKETLEGGWIAVSEISRNQAVVNAPSSSPTHHHHQDSSDTSSASAAPVQS